MNWDVNFIRDIYTKNRFRWMSLLTTWETIVYRVTGEGKENHKNPGVRIIPPMMTFYHKPENLDEMIYHIAAKLIEPFGIEAKEVFMFKI